MRPTVDAVRPVVDPAAAGTRAKGTDVSGSVDAVEHGRPATARREGATKRGAFRAPVHPAYAVMEQAEVRSVDDSAEQLEGHSIQVQVRTRENGRRSPLVAPLTPPMHSISAVFSNPYGSGMNSPIIASSPSVAVAPGTPTMPPMPNANTFLQDLLPSNVVHRALYGKCRFIEFPTLARFDSVPPPPLGASFPLFVGQVRFETTPAELIWLVRRTSGATALALEGRGSGCFIMHLRSESERVLVRQLHKRILFDIGGAWFARSPEEVDNLCEYVTLTGPYLSKRAKLPRESMVVEDIKVGPTELGPCHLGERARGLSAHSRGSSGSGSAWEPSTTLWGVNTPAPFLCTPPSSPVTPPP
ncbi:uncharacterized protein Tco025E_07741 [Trypanosoma conorhini]|uniref:Uncharacterized protein n=1 Tax=Trypanosoma conorhini TaxID=83891 RepID=A0A422NJQ7_9TRYP|nr:uncharacterized protein Tco025E_07741 [Trypanosoma conorhini]RNF05707.1 hypothetical protein Tco025E_07741 [Trypanosoma conorhini]